MNKLSIISLFILAFNLTSLSVSGQYLSMREERSKIDKIITNLFQISVKQEVNGNLDFKILINTIGQELLIIIKK